VPFKTEQNQQQKFTKKTLINSRKFLPGSQPFSRIPSGNSAHIDSLEFPGIPEFENSRWPWYLACSYYKMFSSDKTDSNNANIYNTCI